ncbi:UBA domain-containing protein Mud1 [Schizosaccharomyces cryophilus OY26]|uniref:UBA domain-containing protein Mud1 n=1 Tax=Schizosaccharomyces cryophilus (strain OY26 / ATCC MYA-4695 / CBS 11777 / NBRC 106824 / NRRL Y48691) TaxID=653667 RepID=S9VYF2_SCHCR|nr:UBA domain-containing protein Mud1 [Schizosaccharomyces cryophilus OY26]EPY50820.1 UBA domain-containing protein Mud1 [Schizosaccharomyces cryophilus OY26]
MDIFYLVYFLTHFFAAIFVDLPVFEWVQDKYPSLSAVRRFYLDKYDDPNLKNHAPWQNALFTSEAFIQLPYFLWASCNLWKGTQSPKLWLSMLMYGIHAATTTWICIFELYAQQKWILISFYLPYLVIPLLMSVHMCKRLIRACTVAASQSSATSSTTQKKFNEFPQLAEVLEDPDRFASTWQTLNFSQLLSMPRSSASAPTPFSMPTVSDDELFDVEVQRRIEEQIRQSNIAENMQSAIENHPEVFGQVYMLFVNVEINGHKVKAFVDSGAQATILSADCASRCGLTRLLDTRFSGVAKGVGMAKILGSVHSAPLKIGDLFLPCRFTVIEGRDVDMLLGLDMLRRYQACIDLENNVLRIHGQEVPFLGESEIPKMQASVEPSAASQGLGIEADPSVASASAASVGSRLGTKGDTAPSPSVPAASTSSSNPIVNTSGDPTVESKIAQLTGMGFDPLEAAQALEAANGDIDVAASFLL